MIDKNQNPTAGLRSLTSPTSGSQFQREIDLLLMLYLTIIIFGILFPETFLSASNFIAILNNVACEGMIAIGMMVLLIGGVFDLSVGSIFSMTGVLVGYFMVAWGWSPGAAVPTALLLAMLGGTLNGWLVSKVKVNAMITTLGTLGIFKGIAVLIGGPGINGLPESFTWFGQKEWLGIQLPFWLMLGMAVVAHYLTHSTQFFRQYYFVGSNDRAARLSGIPVETLQWLGFVGVAFIAGLAGIAFASRVGTSVSTAGDHMELRVITAVILGGASLHGGKGNVVGGVIGVFFMAIVANLLIISRVSSYWHGIVVGSILIAAVAYDSIHRTSR